MSTSDIRSLVAILLYGTEASRRELAARLPAEHDQAGWELLANTVRSDDPWLLRARCLEALGVAAANGPSHFAETILRTLLGSPVPDEGVDSSP